MDLERVLKGSQWTFNNHLLMMHCLELGEDPKRVHDVLSGFFNDVMARQLGDFLGKFLKYDRFSLGKGMRSYLRIRVQLDVRHPLKRKKKLGHNDSFCQAKMVMKVEVAEFDWDMSLKAQSRRSLAMNSLWLCDEGEGMNEEVMDNDMGTQRRFAGFYRNLYVRNRDASWNMFRGLGHQQDLLCLVSGDFNEILYVCKKVVGVPRDEGRIEAFRGNLSINGLSVCWRIVN
ncbi:hypothetical protein J1N35_040921 [Gossypium stocksii]|uniref:DUF4283 domain-containing protein n=1 Tax=Gossypium stocksii TaxID=47602 RepID=A0A9D3ZIY8_9ROSI|nr:hypothetical protein J1N35_040921 [Gossypium stocksii]